MSVQRFDWRGVVARALFCLFLVFAVYNPSGTSYLHWVLDGFEAFWLKLATGAALLALLLVVWRTTRGVLGRGGMLVVLAFCLSTGMAVLGATGLALLARETLVIWLLVSIAGLFTAGLCYSHVHHRLGGISHNEQVEK